MVCQDRLGTKRNENWGKQHFRKKLSRFHSPVSLQHHGARLKGRRSIVRSATGGHVLKLVWCSGVAV
jgi:hypothetical protein